MSGYVHLFPCFCVILTLKFYFFIISFTKENERESEIKRESETDRERETDKDRM